MLLPSEFMDSFEKQYPDPKLEYTLPESLDRCPKLLEQVRNTVVSTGTLSFTWMDGAGATYDLLNSRYQTIAQPQWFKLEKTGYDLIFDKVYKIYGGNLSPRSFAFMLEDLSNINAVKFNAELQMQMSKFSMEKSIALQQSWFKFCLEYDNEFTMKFDEYAEVISKLADKQH